MGRQRNVDSELSHWSCLNMRLSMIQCKHFVSQTCGQGSRVARRVEPPQRAGTSSGGVAGEASRGAESVQELRISAERKRLTGSCEVLAYTLEFAVPVRCRGRVISS